MPDLTPADPPAPVPPPVDAPSKFVDEVYALLNKRDDAMATGHLAYRRGDAGRFGAEVTKAVGAAQRIGEIAEHAYAAGVAEGRRQATEERTEEQPAYQRGDDCPTCGAGGDDRG